MVLYKRKHVTYVRPQPLPDDLATPVFHIGATKEWFYTYEEYMARLDFFQQRRFVCEITGNSCLTFFQALDSEKREIKGVEKNFPEALREHILRFLQFNRITRLDHLVDKVYLTFRNDYFPGETIYIKGAVDHPVLGVAIGKQRGIIREKVQYLNPVDGLTTKYLVVRLHDMQQAIVNGDQVLRDRNHFTKWLIKTFIKLTMTRLPKVGAPWVVKQKYAKKYRIPQEFPDDLRHYKWLTPIADVVFEGDLALPEMPDGETEPAAIRRPDLKKSSKLKGRKKPALNHLLDDSAPDGGDAMDIKPTDPSKHLPHHYLPDKLQREQEADDTKSDWIQPTKKTVADDLDLRFDLQNTRPQPQPPSMPANAVKLIEKMLARRQEEVANIDSGAELESHEREPGYREFCAAEAGRLQRSLEFACVQEALETWSFLNIYHRALKLDTFTFDDFVYAMGWTEEEHDEFGRCELMDEIWCAALGAFVSNELPAQEDDDDDEIFGLQVTLPEQPEESTPLTPLKETSPDLKMEEGEEQVEASDENGSGSESEEDGNERAHNAYKSMKFRGILWHDRLRRRNFKDGNWQIVLLGLLSLVEDVPQYQPLVSRVYRILAPPNMAASPATALSQFYTCFDFELRMQTLCLLVTLLSNGTVVRKYIEDCLEQSTVFRRSRLDNIRDYKAVVEVALGHHEQLEQIRADLEDKGTNEKAASDAKAVQDDKRRAKMDLLAFTMTEEEERLAKMSEKYREEWEARKETLLKMEQIRKDRREIERKLVELDSQRLKLLGKDRLFNRYWWFENNGLPTLHGSSKDDENDDDEVEKNDDDSDVDDGEVLEETYLMGTLWVQGPSREDARIHLEMTESECAQLGRTTDTHPVDFHKPPTEHKIVLNDLDYSRVPSSFRALAASRGVFLDDSSVFVGRRDEPFFDRWGCLRRNHRLLTPVQRKLLEECPSPLFSGNTWRVYTEPEQIRNLVGWLNPWGKRESQLRKELVNVSEAIKLSMEARKKAMWLGDEGEREDENHDDKEDHKAAQNEERDEDNNGHDTDEETATGKRNRQPSGRRKKASTEDSGSEETSVPMTRELRRALEWMNSLARDELEKPLYEGGDRAKNKGRKKKDK